MNKFLLKNRLHDYVDGELTLEERREVETALSNHPDLMQEIEDIQAQRNLMLGFGSLKAPAIVLENILTEVDTKQTVANKPRSKHYLPFAVVIAAAILAWMIIPSTQSVNTDVPPELKGAQVLLPTVNSITLPKTSPIEEANKHVLELEDTIEHGDDTKEHSDKPTVTSTATTSEPKKSSTSHPTFVIKTPDSPYVPEWEEGHIIEVTEAEFAPDAFQFKSAPANLLIQLDKLAKSSGGFIKSTSGSSCPPVELTNFSPRAKCELWVPIDAVQKVNKNLTELGGQFFDETIKQSEGYAIFKIDARYKYY